MSVGEASTKWSCWSGLSLGRIFKGNESYQPFPCVVDGWTKRGGGDTRGAPGFAASRSSCRLRGQDEETLVSTGSEQPQPLPGGLCRVWP